MATPRAIVKRLKAVRSIHKITRAMEMIAAVKLQRLRKRTLLSRPFIQLLRQILADLVAEAGPDAHPLLGGAAGDGRPTTNRVGLLVITSNRGLAGAYNSGVLRVASNFIDRQEAAGRRINLYVVGRKGVSYFRFRDRPILHGHEDPGDMPRPDQLLRAVDFFMEQYRQGEVEEVHLVYTRFLSAGVQRPEVMRLLPLAVEDTADSAPQTTLPAHPSPKQGSRKFDYSPDPRAILEEMVPQMVRVLFRQCFLEAVTSENMMRQVAMKRATDNAQKLIKRLTMQYNRARQAQITTELCEIMAGANAVSQDRRTRWSPAARQSPPEKPPPAPPAAQPVSEEEPAFPELAVMP